MTATQLSGYPYVQVEITKSGALHDLGDLPRASAYVVEHGITDLIVISHGWNNNKAEALGLYEALFESIRRIHDGGTVSLGTRKIGVLGVLWPSKKFAEKDMIPAGGAASLGGDQTNEDVLERLEEFAEALDDSERAADIQALREAVPDLDGSIDARGQFADKLRALLPEAEAASDDGSDRFFSAPSEELFNRFSAPFLPAAPGRRGGAAGGAMGGVMGGTGGGAAGIGDWFSGAKAAARRMLNYGTYYTMKARAGEVGAGGVREIAAAVTSGAPATKLHFVGHSFGGRVVTAASKALGEASSRGPSSMSLLQAAFSHNGFAKSFYEGKNGYFRSVMAEVVVDGPVLVTHTRNDKANGIGYALASRLAGQDAASIGGPDDRFGAIGANGARDTPEANEGRLLGTREIGYEFSKGNLYNLDADEFIKGHGDVRRPEVAYAILSAIAAT